MTKRDPNDKLTFFYNGRSKIKAIKLLKTIIYKEEHDLVEFYNEFLIDIYILLDNAKSKYIAIDWDNTISADKELFLMLIIKLQKAGYIPFVCTLRAPDSDNIKEIRGLLEETNISIYLTNGKPKRKYMKKLGIRVHLWIDDFYPGICGDACKILARNKIS